MADIDVNKDLVKKIVQQVLAEQSGSSNGNGSKKIFAFSIRKDEEPYVKEWANEHPDVPVVYKS